MRGGVHALDLARCGVNINTVSKMLVDAGNACAAYRDEHVRGVNAAQAQCDEIWSFIYAEEKNVESARAAPGEAGETWTWMALDADSKLIASYLVGGRDAEYTSAFLHDVAHRLANRVQLTTDGHAPFLQAVDGAFGCDVDFAQLVKLYGEQTGMKGHEQKYSPAECRGARKRAVTGSPAQAHVSTSYVERQNLPMGMHMRRLTRLTNTFSKKFENHAHTVALYTVWYNFVRQHKALWVSPAMAAGISDRLWSMEDIARLVEDVAPKSAPRGPYMKRSSN